MSSLKHIGSDIRFWILLLFIARLYHIANPPLEVAHNWRQTTVTMVARNFVESGADILYPRVDFAGDKTGITGMEFPLLNYLVYLVSQVFGYAHWYGRLINLVVSCFGLLYFYKLVQKYFSAPVAFNATFVLLFSIWFSYSRKIMPDTFSMSLVIAGLYYGSNYLDRKAGFKNVFLYALFVLAGVLSKLPAGYLLIVLSIFLVDKKIPLARKSILCAVSLVIVAVVSAYYFYWVPQLNRIYDFNHFFMGKSIGKGITDIFTHLNEALEKFYAQALGYSGFLLFLWSLVKLAQKKEKKVALVFALCFLAFLVIIFKGGFAFYHHSYYIIPFAPVMALLCGFAVAEIKNSKLAWAVLTVIAIECILTNNADFYIKEQNQAILNLEKDLDRFCLRTDKIFINSGNVPTPMYFAHRKGWIGTNETLLSHEYIAGLKQQGLRYIVILKRVFGSDVTLEYKPIFSNVDYTIYAL